MQLYVSEEQPEVSENSRCLQQELNRIAGMRTEGVNAKGWRITSNVSRPLAVPAQRPMLASSCTNSGKAL